MFMQAKLEDFLKQENLKSTASSHEEGCWPARDTPSYCEWRQRAQAGIRAADSEAWEKWVGFQRPG